MVKPPPQEPTDVRLVELAAEHLRRFGPRRTTVVSIAEEAGMSHANVYRYFPSKSALLEAVVDAWLKPIEKGLRDIADGPDPAQDKLERLASALHRAYRRKLEEDPVIFEVFVAAVKARDAIARRHRARIVAEVQSVVEDGMGSGAFAVENHRDGVALYMDALARFLASELVLQDRDAPAGELEARLDRLVRLVIRALATGKL